MLPRIGVFGCGGIVGFGIEHIVGEFEWAGVADPGESQVREIWASHGVEIDVPFFDSFEQMVDSVDLDGVIIGLPGHLHMEATLKALDAGLPVLCEKPPTDNADQMRRVRDKVVETGLVYEFIRQNRFSPRVQALKGLIGSGQLGSIYYAKTEWVRSRWFSDKGWRHDREKGGGVLLDLGIHAFDNVWFALGCPMPVEVMASMNTTFGAYAPPGVTYTADDASVAMVRFENGVVLHMEVAFAMNTLGRGVTLDERKQWQQVHVYGDKGAYETDQFLQARADEVVAVDLPQPELPHPIRQQIRNFVEAIQGIAEPVNTVNDALALMQVLDAARLSSERRRAVAIEPI